MKITKNLTDENGLLHNEYGPAIEWENGNFTWFFHGFVHNSNGLAVHTVDIQDAWYYMGELHREDGPAIIWYSLGIPDDHLVEPKIKYVEWYYKGKQISCSSQEEFEKLIKLKIFW